MIKLFCTIAMVMLLCSSLFAGEVLTTNGAFKSLVRQFIGVESTELLPDSTLKTMAALAIVNTSVEAGGVESQFRLITVAEQKFYEIPDTVVAIPFTSVISSEGGTFYIRAGYPQYSDASAPDGRIGVADDDPNVDDNQIPGEYHYWADTLQIIPAPIRAGDTLIIKCFVEHKADTANAGTIDFTHPDFTTAALFLTCSYALMSVGEFERATFFEALYTKKKTELIQKYQRRLDVQPTIQE